MLLWHALYDSDIGDKNGGGDDDDIVDDD